MFTKRERYVERLSTNCISGFDGHCFKRMTHHVKKLCINDEMFVLLRFCRYYINVDDISACSGLILYFTSGVGAEWPVLLGSFFHIF